MRLCSGKRHWPLLFFYPMSDDYGFISYTRALDCLYDTVSFIDFKLLLVSSPRRAAQPRLSYVNLSKYRIRSLPVVSTSCILHLPRVAADVMVFGELDEAAELNLRNRV